jgi:hypothetical protein
MSNPDETSASGPDEARPSADSPKPHGDKLASATRAAAGGGRPIKDVDNSGNAAPSGDSPKPHGDKLASAARTAATPQAEGGEPDQSGH